LFSSLLTSLQQYVSQSGNDLERMGLIIQTFNKILELLKLSERPMHSVTEKVTFQGLQKTAATTFLYSMVKEVTGKHLDIVYGITKKGFEKAGLIDPDSAEAESEVKDDA